MIQRFLLFLVGVTLILQACEKTEYVKASPQLEFTVVKDNMVFVEGAVISLYNTQEDWQLRTNAVQELHTDDRGQALFEDLQEQKYYFFVGKEELDNLADIAATSEPLKVGQKSQVLVKIMITNL